MNLLKKSKYVLITLSALIMTACGAGEVEVHDDPKFTSLTGVLDEQSSSDSRAGTHILTNAAGEEFLVNSVAINLSGEQYLGNEVELTGVMDDEAGIFTVSGVSVVNVLDGDNEESELELYKNSELGFQIGYYSNWEINEDGSSVEFYFKDSEMDASVLLDHYTFSYEQSVFDTEDEDSPLASYMARNYPEVGNYSDLVNYVGIDSQEAVKIEDGDLVTYFLYRNGFIYEIVFRSSGELELENVFNEMLSEFRFIGFTPSDDSTEDEEPSEEDDEIDSKDEELPQVDLDFTEFDSLSFEFKASYPSSWYYAGASTQEAGVIRHYGFSDEAIDDNNEILSLDILSSSAPTGSKVNIDGKTLTVVQNSQEVEVFTEVNGRTYRLSGPSDYADVLKIMAASIEKIQAEEMSQ